LMVTALAFVLWYSGMARLGAERAGLFAGLVPVAALLSSAAVGGAAITIPRLVGALTVGAGVAIGMRGSEEARSLTPPRVSGDAVDDLAEHRA
jgi:drug/metabolite transporter (DMT)-like permease